MNGSTSDFRRELNELAEELRTGQLGAERAIDQIESMLANVGPEGLAHRQSVALGFAHEIVSECLGDQDALRIGTLGEVAWRTARRASGDGAAQIALWIGYCLWRRDAPGAALTQLERAVDNNARDAALEAAVATCLRLICLRQLGRFKDAEALYQTAHALALGQALPRLLVCVELSGARSASELDQHSIAERRIRSAIERAKPFIATAPVGSAVLIPEYSLAALHRCWGDVVRHAGHHERAIEIYQLGRKAGRAEGDLLGAIWCLSEIGITWQRLGETTRSASILEEAAKAAEALGDHEAALRFSMRLPAEPGKLLFLSGFNRLSYAMARMQGHERHDAEAERIARQLVTEAGSGQPDVECAARNLLAACYQRRGALNQAVTAAKAAVSCADAADRPLLAIQFRTNLATLYYKAHQLLLAEKVAQEAVEFGERLREDVGTSEIRQAIGAGLAGSYELLILLAGEDLTSVDGRVTRVADAARVAELGQRFRTRNLNRWLTLTNWRIRRRDSRLTQAVRNYVTAETLVEDAASRGYSLTRPLEEHHRAVEVLHSLALDDPALAATQQANPESSCKASPGGGLRTRSYCTRSGHRVYVGRRRWTLSGCPHTVESN